MVSLNKIQTINLFLGGIGIFLNYLYLAIVSFWVLEFYKQRNSLVVNKRFPHLLYLIYFILVFYYAIDRTLYYIYYSSLFGNHEIILLIEWFCYPIPNYSLLYIGVFRFWLFYYDSQYRLHNTSNQWKSILNPTIGEKNWYLNHRKTLGNFKYLQNKVYGAIVVCIILSWCTSILYSPQMPNDVNLIKNYFIIATFESIILLFPLSVLIWLRYKISHRSTNKVTVKIKSRPKSNTFGDETDMRQQSVSFSSTTDYSSRMTTGTTPRMVSGPSVDFVETSVTATVSQTNTSLAIASVTGSINTSGTGASSSSSSKNKNIYHESDRLLLRKEIFHLTNIFLIIFAILIAALVFNNVIIGRFLKFKNKNDKYEMRVIETANLISHIIVGFCTLLVVMVQTKWVLVKFKGSMHAYSSRQLIRAQTSLEDDMLDEKEKMENLQHTHILDVFQSYRAFGLFMAHLCSEHSAECLLALVEFTQYKQWLFDLIIQYYRREKTNIARLTQSGHDDEVDEEIRETVFQIERLINIDMNDTPDDLNKIYSNDNDNSNNNNNNNKSRDSRPRPLTPANSNNHGYAPRDSPQFASSSNGNNSNVRFISISAFDAPETPRNDGYEITPRAVAIASTSNTTTNRIANTVAKQEKNKSDDEEEPQPQTVMTTNRSGTVSATGTVTGTVTMPVGVNTDTSPPGIESVLAEVPTKMKNNPSEEEEEDSVNLDEISKPERVVNNDYNNNNNTANYTNHNNNNNNNPNRLSAAIGQAHHPYANNSASSEIFQSPPSLSGDNSNNREKDKLNKHLVLLSSHQDGGDGNNTNNNNKNSNNDKNGKKPDLSLINSSSECESSQSRPHPLVAAPGHSVHSTSSANGIIVPLASAGGGNATSMAPSSPTTSTQGVSRPFLVVNGNRSDNNNGGNSTVSSLTMSGTGTLSLRGLRQQSKKKSKLSKITIIKFCDEIPKSAVIYPPKNTKNGSKNSDLTDMKLMENVPGTTVSPRVRGHAIKQKTVEYMARARMKSVADHENMAMQHGEYTKEEIVLEAKKKAYALYYKYIMTGSEHEINIDYRARKQLVYLLDDPNLWMTSDAYDFEEYNSMTELFCLFDQCIQSLLQLCKFSFSRFINTKEFGHCDTIIKQSKERRQKHVNNLKKNDDDQKDGKDKKSQKHQHGSLLAKSKLILKNHGSNSRSRDNIKNKDKDNPNYKSKFPRLHIHHSSKASNEQYKIKQEKQKDKDEENENKNKNDNETRQTKTKTEKDEIESEMDDKVGNMHFVGGKQQILHTSKKDSKSSVSDFTHRDSDVSTTCDSQMIMKQLNSSYTQMYSNPNPRPNTSNYKIGNQKGSTGHTTKTGYKQVSMSATVTATATTTATASSGVEMQRQSMVRNESNSTSNVDMAARNSRATLKMRALSEWAKDHEHDVDVIDENKAMQSSKLDDGVDNNGIQGKQFKFDADDKYSRRDTDDVP